MGLRRCSRHSHYVCGDPAMNKYRIMVEGEDGTLFCWENDLRIEEIDPELEQAREDYPNANFIVESYDQVKTF